MISLSGPDTGLRRTRDDSAQIGPGTGRLPGQFDRRLALYPRAVPHTIDRLRAEKTNHVQAGEHKTVEVRLKKREGREATGPP